MNESPVGTSIETAAKLLCENKIVAIPTETVYGLAGNACQARVCAGIFEMKNRPHFDPLIIHLNELIKASDYVHFSHPDFQKLYERFSPGPITYVLPKKDSIPDIVTAGLPNVALRFPSHPLCRDLLDKIDFPLAAPSANPFQYISPTRAEHVKNQLNGKVDYILDGGPCRLGLESTIVDLSGEKAVVLRLGSLDIESLHDCLKYEPEIRTSSSQPSAPGQIERHYAPGSQVLLFESDEEITVEANDFVVYFKRHSEKKSSNILYLSEDGELLEAANSLFHLMREVDALRPGRIFIQRAPERGLGRAINDRLKRAAHNPLG